MSRHADPVNMPRVRLPVAALLASTRGPQAHKSLLKALALENIPIIVVALDTFHDDKSRLNDDAPENAYVNSSTLETSHWDRSPLKALAY